MSGPDAKPTTEQVAVIPERKLAQLERVAAESHALVGQYRKLVEELRDERRQRDESHQMVLDEVRRMVVESQQHERGVEIARSRIELGGEGNHEAGRADEVILGAGGCSIMVRAVDGGVEIVVRAVR